MILCDEVTVTAVNYHRTKSCVEILIKSVNHSADYMVGEWGNAPTPNNKKKIMTIISQEGLRTQCTAVVCSEIDVNF